MSFQTALALAVFAFVMSASPGPANFLILASGANFGFARTLPLILGVSSGFMTMVFCVGLGLGQVFIEAPQIYTALKFACAAYVLWLAWRIARSRSADPDRSNAMEYPATYLQGASLQLVNPKAWAVALIVTVTYSDPANPLPSLIAIIAVFASVNLPSISIWALCGAALRHFLAKGERIVAFNTTMALLLVGSMGWVLLTS